MALLLGSPCWGEPKAAEPAAATTAPAEIPGETVGTFTGIEQGDYFYFKVKPDGGEERSYMILDDSNGLKQFADEPEKFLGKRVRVKWVEKEVEIPEAGGNLVRQVATGAEKLE